MTQLTGVPVNYKIAPPESLSIIGSNSINTAGDLYTLNFNSIGKAANLRTKRLFDLLMSILLIPAYPLWAPFVRKSFRALGGLFQVLAGKRSLVGYAIYPEFDPESLPRIRKGLLPPKPGLSSDDIDAEQAERINIMYAKDYRLSNDISILWKGFRLLGAKK